MGFKHAMLQRSYELAASPGPQLAAAPGPAAIPPHVTDFSISRILGGSAKDNNVKKSMPPNAGNILDLSKSSQGIAAPVPPPAAVAAPIAVAVAAPASAAVAVPVVATNLPHTSVNPSSVYAGGSCSMLAPDFLAMASATKFYAQFFPHLLPAYAAAAAAASLTTPPTSPYQQPQQQKRYFAPYVINGQSPSRPKSSAPPAACTRVDCIECLDYYKQFGAGYKPTPLISPAASSVSNSSSSRPARDLLLTATNNSTSISLTTVTNLNLSTATTTTSASKAGMYPKLGSSISNPNIAEEISYKCRICDKVFGCSETLQVSFAEVQQKRRER